MIEPLGMKQHVPGDQVARALSRFDQRLTYAEKAEEHVWIAIAHYSLTDEAAKRVMTDPNEQVILDVENLGGIHMGCFRCEEPLRPRLIGKRCKGEPK